MSEPNQGTPMAIQHVPGQTPMPQSQTGQQQMSPPMLDPFWQRNLPEQYIQVSGTRYPSIDASVQPNVNGSKNNNGNTAASTPASYGAQQIQGMAHTNGHLDAAIPMSNMMPVQMGGYQVMDRSMMEPMSRSSVAYANTSANANGTPLPPQPVSANYMNNISQMPGQLHKEKRRAAKACEYCRKRKTKCDEVSPYTNKCSNCSKAGVDCIFITEPTKKKRKSSSEGTKVNKSPKPAAKTNSTKHKVKKQSDGDNEPVHQNTVENIAKRMEILDRKMSTVIDNIARFEWLLDKMVQKQNEKVDDTTNQAKPRRRIYTTSLLTHQKLLWMKRKICKNMTDEQFAEPLNSILSNGLKWYVAQIKQYTDFSSPCVYGVEFKVYDLPSELHTRRIMENFNAYLTSVTGVFDSSECYKVTNKYYENKGENMTFTEHLLLNVSICSGALATRMLTSADSQFLRKDRHNPSIAELKEIENNCFLNCMFYYHKISTVCSGPKTLLPLLLLTKYLQANYNTELANTILSTAVRFTIDMSMNKKITYKNLSLAEQIRKRSMWWHFFATDKLFSFTLSRPPMLLEEDMDMLTDQNYLEVIKTNILPKIFKTKEECEQVSDIHEALSIIINYCEYIPFFTSYYVTKLLRIESSLYSTCFSVRNTLDNTFDGLLSKALEIFESLKTWKDNLHPSMRLESYRQYISLLYSQSSDENPALAFELACTHVLACHLRYLYLVVILSMFIVSLLRDNQELFPVSHHEIPKIYKKFSEQYILSSVKLVEIFQGVNFVIHTYNDLIYPFLTGIYVVLMHVVDELDKPKNLEVPSLIELLIKGHSSIMGENFKNLGCYNMKWNVSLYIYTYLLKYIIKYFNENHPLAVEHKFSYEHYDEILEKLEANTISVKKTTVERLKKNLKRNGVFQEVDEAEKTEEENNEKDHIIELFNDLNSHTVKILESDSLLKNSKERISSVATSQDASIFPADSAGFQIIYPIYKDSNKNLNESVHDDNDKKDNNEKNISSSITDADVENFRNLLPLEDFLYDRDFKFIKPFQSYLSRHSVSNKDQSL